MTGTSVIGIKYKDGVLLAADMGGLFLILDFVKNTILKIIWSHSSLLASCYYYREFCFLFTFWLKHILQRWIDHRNFCFSDFIDSPI